MVLLAAREMAEPFLHWNDWLPTPLFEPVHSVVRFVGVPYARDVASPIAASGDVWIRSANNLISVGLLVALRRLGALATIPRGHRRGQAPGGPPPAERLPLPVGEDPAAPPLPDGRGRSHGDGARVEGRTPCLADDWTTTWSNSPVPCRRH